LIYTNVDELRTYFKTYIDTYVETVRSKGKGQEPDLFRDQPVRIDVRILPNEAIVALFFARAGSFTIDVQEDSYDNVLAIIQKRGHKYLKAFLPTKNFSDKDAAADARDHVGKDTRRATYRAGLVAAKGHVQDVIKAIEDTAKTNPWLEGQLKEVRTGLQGAGAPIAKLVEEHERMDKEDVFKDQDAFVRSLMAVDVQNPQVVDENAVGDYLRAYLQAYREAVKPEYPDRAKPRFFKGMPMRVRASLLSNMSVAVYYRFSAPEEAFIISRERFNEAQARLKEKDVDDYEHLPPLKPLTTEAAVAEARAAVKEDIMNTLHLALLTDTKAIIQENKMKVLDITKTNPWLEDQMKSLATRLEGVTKLIEVLVEELEGSTILKRPVDTERMFLEVSRFKAPKKPEPELYSAPGPVFVPIIAPVVPVAPVVSEETVSYTGPNGPAWAPGAEVISHASAGVYADEPGMGAGGQGMSNEERAQLEDMTNRTFEFGKRIDDFERRLRYMDKYIEHEVQRRQDEKLKLQDEKVSHQISRTASISYGLATVAILLTIGVLLLNLDALREALGHLFG